MYIQVYVSARGIGVVVGFGAGWKGVVVVDSEQSRLTVFLRPWVRGVLCLCLGFWLVLVSDLDSEEGTDGAELHLHTTTTTTTTTGPSSVAHNIHVHVIVGVTTHKQTVTRSNGGKGEGLAHTRLLKNRIIG